MNGPTSSHDHSSPAPSATDRVRSADRPLPPAVGPRVGLAGSGPAVTFGKGASALVTGSASAADWRVILPVLDEAAALPHLLAEMASVPGLLERAVFVDNGSRDGGPALIAAAGGLVVTEARRGYGHACLRGLVEARGAGASVVAFMEADGSDDPADLSRLVGPVLSGDLDLLLGSRRAAVAALGGMPWHQRFGNGLARAFLAWLFGLRIPDNGPYRAVRTDLLERLDMEPRAYAWTTEMLIKAHLRGARVTWVEVGFRRRTGRSKIAGSVRGTLGAFAGIFGTMVRLWWCARRPLPLGSHRHGIRTHRRGGGRVGHT